WKLTLPEVSIRVGSAHMATLFERYENNPALVLAAYNAGEPAVNRWLSKRGHLELDMFIEEIPYTETNRYVKKVLSFYAIYQALYESDSQPLELIFVFSDELIARAKKSHAVQQKIKAERKAARQAAKEKKK
ncbi:MAG: transglycosylase SLT domain-containing protein, partial [Deltaproteobacteria bacterium]|nr:transglycosylase SLT domain-containing protein [Deltaproteobacteria bacterium]